MYYLNWFLVCGIFIFLRNLNSHFTYAGDFQKFSDGFFEYNSSFHQNYEPKINLDCRLDRLVIYKVILHTYWTRELFPKHYPDWRPPAQWTKTFGRSHDSGFSLFHIGQPASQAVKIFAETGKLDILEGLPYRQMKLQQTQSHSDNNVLDEFLIPSIPMGYGVNEARFFVDGNHSLVSLITRIIPSPDWFIGVDSFQLCVGGNWIDTVTIEMNPLDAGTDNGFTFTAPNWPTVPQGVIYRITSKYPAHPAGSFFYPKSKQLPPIATFQFIKLKEYELSEVYSFKEDEKQYETIITKNHLEIERNHIEINNKLSASIEIERQSELGIIPPVLSEKEKVRKQLLTKLNPSNNITWSENKINHIPKKQSKQAPFNSIGQNNSLIKHHTRFYRGPRDCRVGHWSEWSACSQSCGIGEMKRHRKIIKYAKRGGRTCPPLQESKWCGSYNCQTDEKYFIWNNKS